MGSQYKPDAQASGSTASWTIFLLCVSEKLRRCADEPFARASGLYSSSRMVGLPSNQCRDSASSLHLTNAVHEIFHREFNRQQIELLH